MPPDQVPVTGSGPLDPASPAPQEPPSVLPRPTGWVTVAVGCAGDLEPLSLVLSATGIVHRIDRHTGQLLVPTRHGPSARFHLEQYHQENLDWPSVPVPHRPLPDQPQPTLLLMALLALFFFHTGPWSQDSPWFARGAIDSAAILGRGEWWRLVTALTLHADLVHLAGNCLLGGLIIHLLGQTIGPGLTWLALLLSGATGNLLNIAVRQQGHASVGLSTAVFAAIGLFTGLQLAQFSSRSLRQLILPLGAGAGLLAFLGSEGMQTDLGAHFFGFLAGIGHGILLGLTALAQRLRQPFLQGFLLMLALFLLLLCWGLALD